MPSRDLQAVLDAAVDAVILIDHAGLITGFSRSAERLFGYTGADVLGQDVKLLIPELTVGGPDNYLERTGDCEPLEVGHEVEGRRRDGSFFPALFSAGKISDAESPQVVGFVRD